LARASACHAEGRGFKSHQPLPKYLQISHFYGQPLGESADSADAERTRAAKKSAMPAALLPQAHS
jgi:hypothetical protein